MCQRHDERAYARDRALRGAGAIVIMVIVIIVVHRQILVRLVIILVLVLVLAQRSGLAPPPPRGQRLLSVWTQGSLRVGTLCCASEG